MKKNVIINLFEIFIYLKFLFILLFDELDFDDFILTNRFLGFIGSIF